MNKIPFGRDWKHASLCSSFVFIQRTKVIFGSLNEDKIMPCIFGRKTSTFTTCKFLRRFFTTLWWLLWWLVKIFGYHSDPWSWPVDDPENNSEDLLMSLMTTGHNLLMNCDDNSPCNDIGDVWCSLEKSGICKCSPRLWWSKQLLNR